MKFTFFTLQFKGNLLYKERALPFYFLVFGYLIVRELVLSTLILKKYDAEYCKNNDFIKADTSVDAALQQYVEIAVNFSCNL